MLLKIGDPTFTESIITNDHRDIIYKKYKKIDKTNFLIKILAKEKNNISRYN